MSAIIIMGDMPNYLSVSYTSTHHQQPAIRRIHIGDIKPTHTKKPANTAQAILVPMKYYLYVARD